MKKMILFVLVAALALSVTGCSSKEERSQYKEAVALYEDGKYASALKLFETLDDYKDTEDYLADCRYYEAMQTVSPDSSLERGYSGNIVACTDSNASQYSRAVELLELLDGYQDSERMLRAADKELDKTTRKAKPKDCSPLSRASSWGIWIAANMTAATSTYISQSLTPLLMKSCSAVRQKPPLWIAGIPSAVCLRRSSLSICPTASSIS